MTLVENGSKTSSQRFHVIPLSFRFKVEVVEPPACFKECLASSSVQAIWDKEQEKAQGKLHEGQLLIALEYNERKIKGCFLPYKYLLAIIRDPSLKAGIPVRPVSVNGVIITNQAVLLAQRALWVSQYPGYFELAPSGGVHPALEDDNQVNLKEILESEIVEELHLKSDEVRSLRFFALIVDRDLEAIEICAEIHLKSHAIFTTSSEYPQIMTLPLSEIPLFLTKHRSRCVPLSAFLLENVAKSVALHK